MSPRAHTYGPVPSRRLGSSLGVDVAPFKACSYDCIYCQLGPTTKLTTERTLFFPVDEVIEDVGRRLASCRRPDVITVAGSGEPTLYLGLGELIEGIKRITDIPVALLTNGSLFFREDVRVEAALADIVLPSLDAGDEETFRLVNRPSPGLTLSRVVGGLAAFRDVYGGKVWLEVMVLAGMTDTAERLAPVAEHASRLRPDRIHLNTPVRPTFNEQALPLPDDVLAGLCAVFTPAAEVVTERPRPYGDAAADASSAEGEVVALIRRRPCTVDDIAEGLSLHRNAVLKVLAALGSRGAVHRVLRDGRVFWHAIERPAQRERDS